MNKKMQKVLALVIIMALCLAMVATFVACGDKTPAKPAKGSMTLVIAAATEGGQATEYVVDLSTIEGEGLMPVLEYLKANKNMTLVYTMESWGAYITQLGELKDEYSEKGTFVQLWTSVDADKSTAAGTESTTIKGKTVTVSGVGASSMHVEDGAVIYVNLGTY